MTKKTKAPTKKMSKAKKDMRKKRMIAKAASNMFGN